MRTLPFSQNGISLSSYLRFRPCEWTHRSPLTSGDPEAESSCYRRALYRHLQARRWGDHRRSSGRESKPALLIKSESSSAEWATASMRRKPPFLCDSTARLVAALTL